MSLPESTKYDFFMDELSSLEKQFYAFAQKSDELLDENEELKNRIEELSQENIALKSKIKEIEERISELPADGGLFGESTMNPEEKTEIKNKINDLISRIDNHLRS